MLTENCFYNYISSFPKLTQGYFSSLNADVYKKIPLKDLVSFRIGGPAKYFIVPKDTKSIQEALKTAQEKKINSLVLGHGSNLLFESSGYDGLIIYAGLASTESIQIIKESASSMILKVPAAISKHKLLKYSIEHHLSGLEFSAGIPGCLGGAVYMNAGTKWGSYSECIEFVEFYHPDKGFYEVKNAELAFKYRGLGEKVFSKGTVVLSLQIKLTKEKNNHAITKKVDKILCYRGEKQPLELPNCGSVFKNPENSKKGAGRLIEASKLKGFKVGGAMISEKHANFILNTGSASSDDVKKLCEHIQKRIFQEHAIELERELIYVCDLNKKKDEPLGAQPL